MEPLTEKEAEGAIIGQPHGGLMAEEDAMTASMSEGSIDINGWKATGIRLYSLALIVLIPFVLAACIVAYRTGDISDLKEIALIVIAFFFGKKA